MGTHLNADHTFPTGKVWSSESSTIARCVLSTAWNSLCYEVLIMTSLSWTGWHKIDYVLIMLYQDCSSQPLNLSDLFPFLLPVTLIIFQPPSPDLADRDQMVTGYKLPQHWVHDVRVSTQLFSVGVINWDTGSQFLTQAGQILSGGLCFKNKGFFFSTCVTVFWIKVLFCCYFHI